MPRARDLPRLGRGRCYEPDCAALAGGNLLRALRAAEAFRDASAATEAASTAAPAAGAGR